MAGEETNILGRDIYARIQRIGAVIIGVDGIFIGSQAICINTYRSCGVYIEQAGVRGLREDPHHRHHHYRHHHHHHHHLPRWRVCSAALHANAYKKRASSNGARHYRVIT